MNEIEKWAQKADFIVNGYAFASEGGIVHVLNLNNMTRSAVLDKAGKILETNMDDIEISIIQSYWKKNRQFAEE